MGKALLIIGFILIAFVAVTLWRANAREAAAEKAYPPEGQTIEVKGYKVHAVVRGEGPDLVLIHGASGSTRDYTHTLVAQLESDYRVIVLDRPGFGYTPRLHKDGESLEEQAALLSAAAAELGADRPIVLGQSFGGAVALAWAVHHPDTISGLVLARRAFQYLEHAHRPALPCNIVLFGRTSFSADSDSMGAKVLCCQRP